MHIETTRTKPSQSGTFFQGSSFHWSNNGKLHLCLHMRGGRRHWEKPGYCSHFEWYSSQNKKSLLKKAIWLSCQLINSISRVLQSASSARQVDFTLRALVGFSKKMHHIINFCTNMSKIFGNKVAKGAPLEVFNPPATEDEIQGRNSNRKVLTCLTEIWWLWILRYE